MADKTPASPTASPVAAPPPLAIGGAASEQERYTAIVEKIQKDAAKADLAERQAALAAEPPEEVEEPTAEASEPAAEPAEEAEEPAEEEAAAKTPPTGRELAKIKALLASDPAAAVDELEKALGKDGLKALKLDSKQWAAWRHEKRSLRAELDGREAQLEQIHGKLADFHASLQPLAQARQAFEDGDYQKAHELAFGMDINEFQKQALRQKAGTDPKVAKLERELAEERRIRETAAAEKAQAEQARAVRQAEADYLSELTEEVATFEDPQLAAAAKLPGFAEQVLQIQRDHFDRRTKTSLPTITAAEMALASFREAHDRWATVFASLDQSDTSEEETDRAAPVKAATPAKVQKGKPVQAPPSGAKPRKSLTQSSATEAVGPGRALSPDEIYQKHLRLMERRAVEELAQELG